MMIKKIGLAVTSLLMVGMLPVMHLNAQDAPVVTGKLQPKLHLPDGDYPPNVHHILLDDHEYRMLYRGLNKNVNNLRVLLNNVTDEVTYEVLYNAALSLANTIPNGRVLIALPDGTVVVDTSKPTDFTNINSGYANSYAHFQNKNVNENHNTRVAVFDAQLFPVGIGVETKFSTTDGTNEQYVAIRLGNYLNSSGTARFSQHGLIN